MSLLDLLAQPAGRLATLALLHFVWQATGVMLLLAVVVELLGIRRAGARYACSLTALVAMTMCPLATLVWLETSGKAAGDSDGAATAKSLENAGHLPVAAKLPADWHSPLSISALQPYLLAAWLAGVAGFSVRLLGGAAGLAQLRRGRQPLPRELLPIVERLGKRLAIEAVPLVFLSRKVADAMAVGVVRPLVLIPASWITEMPLEVLEAVVAHELAHLRRRDLWVNLLQRVVETLFFYHPAVWWLSRRLRMEREWCADELAVAVTGKRLVYAKTLEQVAQRQARVRPALAAFLSGETDMRLLHRVRNVLGLTPSDQSRLWPAGLVALALPLGMWAAAIGLASARADDKQEKEREKPSVEARERSEKENVRRVEIRVRRDGDEREAGGKDDEDRKDRDRESEARREGGREKEGQSRKEERREESRKETVTVRRVGDKEIVEREIIEVGEKDAKPVITRRIEAHVAPKREGDPRIDELAAMVKRLSARVERLQDEIAALRGEKVSAKKPLSIEALEKKVVQQRKEEEQARAAKERAEEARAAAEARRAAPRVARERDEVESRQRRAKEDDARARKEKEERERSESDKDAAAEALKKAELKKAQALAERKKELLAERIEGDTKRPVKEKERDDDDPGRER